jgi:hypothetical protein
MLSTFDICNCMVFAMVNMDNVAQLARNVCKFRCMELMVWFGSLSCTTKLNEMEDGSDLQ